MSTLQIELPEGLRTYVEAKVAESGYRSASEFLQALIEADRQRRSRERVERELLEAVDGPFEEWTEKDIEDIERVGTRIIERRKAK